MVSVWLIITILVLSCNAQFAPDGFRDQSPPTNKQDFKQFPKLLWTYWNSGLNDGKIWTKLCLNNLNHFSKISGYQLRFLTDQNLTNYLSEQNSKRFQEYVALLPKNKLKIQAKSDLLRAFLMYQHGGIYLDANSYFTRDFQWASRLYQWPWVYNRISPDAQVLLMTMRKDTSYKGNQTRIFDQRTGQNVTLFPGFQNWFMMARPNSLFYKTLLDHFGLSLEKGYDWMIQDSLARGIDFKQQYSSYFMLGNFALSSIIRNKQLELDKDPYPTPYAVDYYKIWAMHSQYSGYFFYLNILNAAKYLVPQQFSIEDFDEMYEYPTQVLFIKSSGGDSQKNQQMILNFYNKSCIQALHQVQPQSIIYQSLINITSMFPEVDSLKQTFSYNQGKCNVLSQATQQVRQILDSFRYTGYAALFALIIGVPVGYLLRLTKLKAKKK